MATVMKDNQNRSDANEGDDEADRTDAAGDGAERDDVRELSQARQKEPRSSAGFFTIYKKGQGYWTRMGTLFGVILLVSMLAYTLYAQVPGFFTSQDPAGQALARKIGLGLSVGFVVIAAIIAIRLMNKPSNVDFLIATDSEMKKVNWTSRKELVGASKVVILFMFFIAAFLFLMDLIFGWLMFWIDVLKLPPPPFQQ